MNMVEQYARRPGAYVPLTPTTVLMIGEADMPIFEATRKAAWRRERRLTSWPLRYLVAFLRRRRENRCDAWWDRYYAWERANTVDGEYPDPECYTEPYPREWRAWYV